MRKIVAAVAGIILSMNLCAEGIGIVDKQEVFEKYPESQKTVQYLEKKKVEFEVVLKDIEAKLDAKEKDVAKKGDKATKAEKDELDKMKAERKSKFEAHHLVYIKTQGHCLILVYPLFVVFLA